MKEVNIGLPSPKRKHPLPSMEITDHLRNGGKLFGLTTNFSHWKKVGKQFGYMTLFEKRWQNPSSRKIKPRRMDFIIPPRN